MLTYLYHPDYPNKYIFYPFQVIIEEQDLGSAVDLKTEPLANQGEQNISIVNGDDDIFAVSNNGIDNGDSDATDTGAIYVTDNGQFSDEVESHFIDGEDGPMQLVQIRMPNTNELAWVNIVADGD